MTTIFTAPGIEMTIPQMLAHIRDGIHELNVDLPPEWITMLEEQGHITITNGTITKKEN